MRKHGTVRRYLQGPPKSMPGRLLDKGKGCRCVSCVGAHSDYMKKWRATGTNLIDMPEVIRRRLISMVTEDEHKWTIHGLAQALGMQYETLRLIIAGTTKRIRPATLEKLGALPELAE